MARVSFNSQVRKWEFPPTSIKETFDLLKVRWNDDTLDSDSVSWAIFLFSNSDSLTETTRKTYGNFLGKILFTESSPGAINFEKMRELVPEVMPTGTNPDLSSTTFWANFLEKYKIFDISKNSPASFTSGGNKNSK